ncbi:MAG: hypothetical protein AAGF15_10550 [Pseudomonadota bacterium]
MSIERIYLIMLSSGDYEAVFSGLYTAAALAQTRKVFIMAHLGATRVLLDDAATGWTQLATTGGKSPRDLDHERETAGVAGVEALLTAASKAGARFFTTKVGLAFIGVKKPQFNAQLNVEEVTLGELVKRHPQAHIINF